jgi:hypothetical protein
MIVLSSTEVDPFKLGVSPDVPEALLHEEIEAKSRLYTEFARSVPRGEFRPAEGGHVTIHLRGEDTVVAALQDLLARCRAGSAA